MKRYIVSVLAVLALFMNSCTSEFDPGGTVVEKLAGDWWVYPAYDFEGEDDDFVDYDKFATYNTADNNNQMWIEFTLLNDTYSDYESIKFKVDCDVDNKTFATPAAGATNTIANDGVTYKITNGVVGEKDAETAGGNTSDSISFDLELSTRPGLVVHVSGYRRTKFTEDDLF